MLFLCLNFQFLTVFAHFQLDICCGLTEEDFQPSKAMLEVAASCPYPQLHEDFSDLKFYRSLRKCMLTCGIKDFGWKDLHNPTAKRLRCQLSAAINMAKFREDQLKLYAELNEPVRGCFSICVVLLCLLHRC